MLLIGDHPASRAYVSTKARVGAEAGIAAAVIALPEATTTDDLLARIAALNADPAVHGILVQLPLPAHLDAARVRDAIAPEKDVDGFHPLNVGRLHSGAPLDGLLAPCTPLGCLRLLLAAHDGDLRGLNAVVIGRSNIVGKPMAALLLAADCTVTIAHSRTADLPAVCRRADILVAAVGRPGMVGGDWIRPGASVIDVGINRIDADGEGKARLVGDVAFDEARTVAGAITPVPGGVGPMTVAGLLRNTALAYEAATAGPR